MKGADELMSHLLQANFVLAEFYDKTIYKPRHLIENSFAKLKQYRAIAAHYAKISKNFFKSIHLAPIIVWLNWGQALVVL